MTGENTPSVGQVRARSTPVELPVWQYSSVYCACRSLIPSTCAVKLPVDSHDSRYGILMENSSVVPSGVPRVKMENDAGASVEYSASAAAIFIGWACTIALPRVSPEITAAAKPPMTDQAPNFTAVSISSTC